MIEQFEQSPVLFCIFNAYVVRALERPQTMNTRNPNLVLANSVGDDAAVQRGDQSSWSAKQSGYGGGYGYGYGGYDERPDDSESLAHYWHAIIYRKWIVAAVLVAGFNFRLRVCPDANSHLSFDGDGRSRKGLSSLRPHHRPFQPIRPVGGFLSNSD